MSAPFIVLEGLDGVGKTTLARALAQSLGGVLLDTPGASLRLLRREILDGLGPHQTARCLFYAATVLVVGTEARRIADAGTPVVVDRYWLSTRAYALARGVTMGFDDIESTVPRTDVTVLLTLDEVERCRRLEVRGPTAADRETMDPRFRTTVITDMRRPGPHAPNVEVDVTALEPTAGVHALRHAIDASALRVLRACG